MLLSLFGARTCINYRYYCTLEILINLNDAFASMRSLVSEEIKICMGRIYKRVTMDVLRVLRYLRGRFVMMNEVSQKII